MLHATFQASFFFFTVKTCAMMLTPIATAEVSGGAAVGGSVGLQSVHIYQ